MSGPRRCRRWTASELDALWASADQPAGRVAAALGRSVQSVHVKRCCLGIHVHRRWEPWELRALFDGSLRDVAGRTGRSENSVACKRCEVRRKWREAAHGDRPEGVDGE